MRMDEIESVNTKYAGIRKKIRWDQFRSQYIRIYENMRDSNEMRKDERSEYQTQSLEIKWYKIRFGEKILCTLGYK